MAGTQWESSLVRDRPEYGESEIDLFENVAVLFVLVGIICHLSNGAEGTCFSLMRSFSLASLSMVERESGTPRFAYNIDCACTADFEI